MGEALSKSSTVLSVIPHGVSLPHSNVLQYYVKRENFNVNDVIFPSGYEARAINLGNKNMKIGIFTGATSVRSKNIFTDISRYPNGKHEINREYVYIVSLYIKIFNEVGRIDNFRALVRKLSFLTTELDFFDIQQYYVRFLFIFQRLLCSVLLLFIPTNLNLVHVYENG